MREHLFAGTIFELSGLFYGGLLQKKLYPAAEQLIETGYVSK